MKHTFFCIRIIKQIFICLLLTLGSRYATLAQTNPYGEVTIASPNAASLGKYADIPVSYHTGIPQINLPLYTIEAGPLKMPISLNYHASGLKVNELSSWVGAGWSLDAGGVITRTVVGLPDERNTNSGGVDIYGYFTDYGFNTNLYTSSGNQDQDWVGFSQGRKDGEPDLFFFNFGGYSGKFLFRDDRTPILIPQQDLKIVPYYPDTSKSIQGFMIITPDGTQYLFGNTPGLTGMIPTEITNPYSTETGFGSATAISSWFLNKVTSADGQFSISLNYASESYGYYLLSGHILSTQPDPNEHEFDLVKNILSGVRLSSINFPTGVITFTPGTVRTDLSNSALDFSDNVNTSAAALGTVSVADNSGFCKNYNFKYSYYIDNTTAQPAVITQSGYTMQTDKMRLRLDSIQEITCDNSLRIPSHTFTYFNEQPPRRLALGVDHWGFYNGVTSNQTLVPTFNTYDGSTLTPVMGGNRTADWPAMRSGALQQLTYPTGGSTTFEFEPADTYISSYSVLESVPIGGETIHLYGQNTFTQTTSFTSNGNDITLSVNNSANYSASYTIQSGATQVYLNASIPNNSYPGSQITTYTISLPAGTYTGTLSINTNATGGAQASLSQLAYVVNNDPVTIGGLRIKTITHKESPTTATPIVTSYSYPNGGYLYSFPTYVQHIRNDLIATYGFYLLSGGGGFQFNQFNITGCALSGGYYLKTGGSLRPMSTTQGYHIGYPVVKVSQTGNGYSLYNYYSTNTGFAPQTLDPTNITIDVRLQACANWEPNYPPTPLSFDYRKGELYYEQHYNEAGQLLRDAYYYPQYDTTNLQPAPGFIVVSKSTPSGSILFGTFYNLYSPRKTQMHTIQTTYTPGSGNGVASHKYEYYGSSFHNQLTREVHNTSTGDSLCTNTLYTADLHSASWDVNPSCNTTYINTCTSCLTTYNNAQAGCAGNNTCISGLFMNYKRCLSDARNSYTHCQTVNYTGSTNTYNTNHLAAKNAAGAELKPILELQDESRIIPIEVSNWKNTNLLSANFTRFDYVPYPSTIPFPNKTQQVNLTVPSATFTSAVISGTSLSKDSRYQDEAQFAFLGGHPARVTEHDGSTTSYIWDYANTEPIAKTTGTTGDTTAYTSFESDGVGNWNFTSTVRDATTAITGGKSYNLTNGSIGKSGLTIGKKYVVSYWSKSGSYTVTGASSNVRTGRIVNGWTYYENTITTSASSITIAGTGNIDELRLYPQGALMTTYTYQPVVGMTAMADPNGEVTYYEYDALARLKNVKDYQGNILRNNQYNYNPGNGCGVGCTVVPMQTYKNTNTLSYPVGVFNVNGILLGNATNQAGYITLWNSDAANSAIGVLSAGADSMHFKITVNAGQTAPLSVIGCRYYQYDLSFNQIDAIRNTNGCYVDFGDGTGMHLGINSGDSNVIRAANTTLVDYYSPVSLAYYIYWIHTYPNSNLKTITLYHDDDVSQTTYLDNWNAPATSLTLISNFRGVYPQNSNFIGNSCFQQASANTVANITNWSSITSITEFGENFGDGINPNTHMSYAQNFLANDLNLQTIATTRGTYQDAYIDLTFKLSKLQTNWNTYFTHLQNITINDDHWNREDLSALHQLKTFVLIAANQNHSDNSTSNPLIQIPGYVLDNILNQMSTGAGAYLTNGNITIYTGGSSRTTNSDGALTYLKSRGWTINFNGTNL